MLCRLTFQVHTLCSMTSCSLRCHTLTALFCLFLLNSTFLCVEIAALLSDCMACHASAQSSLVQMAVPQCAVHANMPLCCMQVWTGLMCA